MHGTCRSARTDHKLVETSYAKQTTTCTKNLLSKYSYCDLICMLDTILVSGEYSRILHGMDSGGYVHIILAADWYAHRILLKGKVIYICICNFSWNSNVNFRKNKEEQNRGTVD